MSDPKRAGEYPGADASPVEVQTLAGEYRSAAKALLGIGRKGYPLSRAPFRLVAIHAIELHLNALLLASGHSPSDLRRLQHNLEKRLDLAKLSGLKLRKRTEAHIRALVETREYLGSRYDPRLTEMSQLNRLTATLEELAKKASQMIDRLECKSRSGARP